MSEEKATIVTTAPPEAKEGQISTAHLLKFLSQFRADPKNLLAANVKWLFSTSFVFFCCFQIGAHIDLKEAALERAAFVSHDHKFSHKVNELKATNQKSTGRCWIFAALNVIRLQMVSHFQLKTFEFSQSYLADVVVDADDVQRQRDLVLQAAAAAVGPGDGK